jgi:hypothetical protein
MTKPLPGNTTARGYGWAHQKRRAQLLAALIDGTPCAHCGQPMHQWQKLDADHTTSRANGGGQADRLLHTSCNRSRKAGVESPTTKRWQL